MIDERRQIALPFTERRKPDDAGREPVVEVLAEPAGRHFRAQVAVGGGDDPDVDGNRPVRSEPPDGLLLQRAEDLDLGGQRELSDLVEEQRAAAGGFEVAGVGTYGAGECTPHVPEEQRLDETFRQRAAVDLLERAAAAAALGVDGAREQLLAGPRLALDEHGDIVGSDASGAGPGTVHRRAAAEDPVEFGRLRRQAGGQAGQLAVGFAQERRHVLGRDVERHGDGSHPGLRMRLDQLGGVACLG